MSLKKLIFVTGNENKLREVTSIVGNGFPFHISSMKKDLPEYQGSIEEICRKKCLDAVKMINAPVLIEDTCLCFNAYKGLPGPYIKWFLESVGCDGLNKMLSGFDDKSATAVCTFALCEDPNIKEILIFKGEVAGSIVFPRGINRFGWDPIFQPIGYEKTFAEMDPSEKNEISHRRRAIDALRHHYTKNADFATQVEDTASSNCNAKRKGSIPSNAE